MSPLGILFQGDYPTTEIAAASEPAPTTNQLPIWAGQPEVHRTRYVKRSLWRRITTSPFASDVREHGSSAWMVAMASLPMGYAVAHLLMGQAR